MGFCGIATLSGPHMIKDLVDILTDYRIALCRASSSAAIFTSPRYSKHQGQGGLCMMQDFGWYVGLLGENHDLHPQFFLNVTGLMSRDGIQRLIGKRPSDWA
jgi:hypothetical protein